MADKVLVTGATGAMGFELVRALWRRNVAIRAATRAIGNRPSLSSANIEWVAFDFGQPDTFAGALAGVNKLFLLRPSTMTEFELQLFPFLDYAVNAGVQQIVFLSRVGAHYNPALSHYKIEQHIRRTLVPFTFLRANLFMQNLITEYRDDMCRNYQIFIPAGVGRISFVDVRDVAETAAITLVEKGHQHHAYELTGGEALTFTAIAATLADILDLPITYAQPSSHGYAQRMRADGLAEADIAQRQRRYYPLRLGLHALQTRDMERILGHPPITFRRFAQDHADAWCTERG